MVEKLVVDFEKKIFFSVDAQRKRIIASYKRKKPNLLLPLLKRSNSPNTVKREDFSKFYLAKRFYCIWKKCSTITNDTSQRIHFKTPLMNTLNLQKKTQQKSQLNKQTKNSLLSMQDKDTNLVINCILIVFCKIKWLNSLLVCEAHNDLSYGTPKHNFWS